VVGGIIFGVASAKAQPVGFTGSFSQNFDAALTNGATGLPRGFGAVVISSGAATAASPLTSANIASGTGGAGTVLLWNAGNVVNRDGTHLFNVGCWDGTNLDRALGTDPTGINAMAIQLTLTNGTAGMLYGVTFSYDCKCLTNGVDKSGFTDP